MEPSRRLYGWAANAGSRGFFSLVGQFDTLDGPAGVLDEFVIAGAFPFLPTDAVRVAVFVDRPHAIGVKTGSNIVVLASFGIFAGGFGLAALHFAACGSARELARDI